MTGLAEFLLARIAEDEAVARNVTESVDAAGQWHALMYAYEGIGISPGPVPSLGSPALDNVDMTVETRHVTRWSPGHVLAECDAKRRIIKVVSDSDFEWTAVCDHILSLLALPYIDHPDYRHEWRP